MYIHIENKNQSFLIDFNKDTEVTIFINEKWIEYIPSLHWNYLRSIVICIDLENRKTVILCGVEKRQKKIETKKK